MRTDTGLDRANRQVVSPEERGAPRALCADVAAQSPRGGEFQLARLGGCPLPLLGEKRLLHQRIRRGTQRGDSQSGTQAPPLIVFQGHGTKTLPPPPSRTTFGWCEQHQAPG